MAEAGSGLGAAAQDGDLALVRELIQAGAAINVPNENGATALHRAAAEGHLQVVQELIQAEAAMDVKDNDTRSALVVATSKGHSEVVRELIRAGADSGHRLLGLAADKGHLEVVRALVQAGATIDAQDHDIVHERAALVLAASREHLEVVQELIKAGATLDAQGRTALNKAAGKGHYGVVHALIAAGVTNLENALAMARTYDRTDVAHLLERKMEARPLQVFCSRDSAALCVTCVNMVGDNLADFTLEPDAKFHGLVDVVHERLPLESGRWTLVLPTGEVPDEVFSRFHDVQSLFGLSCDA